MAAGPNLRDFRVGLDRTAANIRDLEGRAEDLRGTVREARAALETPGRIERQADRVGDTIDKLQLNLKVVEKVSFLKPGAIGLELVTRQVERAADGVEAKARSLRKQIEDRGWIDTLKSAEAKLSELETKLNGTALAVSGHGTSTQSFIDGLDDAGPPAQPVADAADVSVEPANAAIDPLNTTYETIRDDVVAVQHAVRSADFRPVLDVGNAFDAVVALVDEVDVPLSIAYSVLKPVEPLLDAAGFVFDMTVGPIIDFLVDKFEIDELMAQVGDEILALLPDFEPLDTLIAEIEGVFGDITEFVDDGFDIESFLAEVQAEVIDAVSDATAGATGIGTAAADELAGDAFADLLDGGAGDDTLAGGRGNDLLVASAGDDVLDGGGSFDIAAFAGDFLSYVITDVGDDGRLVLAHATPERDSTDQGTETLIDIERLVFPDRTVRTAVLVDGIRTEADAAVEAGGGLVLEGRTEDDFLYGGTRPIEIRGFAGDDLMLGSTAADVLVGARGDDTFFTRTGADRVFGGLGSDTWLYSDDGRNGGIISVDLRDGTSFDGFDRDALVNIENVAVQIDLDTTARGDAGPNVLETGGGDDWLDGRGGDDLLDGGAGRDLLIGGPGTDVVRAGPGVDDLVAGGRVTGSEFYDGGDGFDTLIYSTDFSGYDIGPGFADLGPQEASGPVNVFAGRGLIHRLDDARARVLATDRATGMELFVGSEANDVLRGGRAAPGETPIRIDGAGGDDWLYSDGAGRVSGGHGDDHLIATIPGGVPVNTTFEGDSGIDTLDLTREDVRWSIRLVGSISQRLEGFQPIDRQALGATASDTDDERATRVFSGSLDDIEYLVLGGEDDELFLGGSERMTVQGGAGDDRLLRATSTDGTGRGLLYGQGGDDVMLLEEEGELHGNAGDDELEVATYADELRARGGQGDDYVLVRRGEGQFTGDGGYDTLVFAPSSRQTTLSLDLTAGTVETIGTSGRIAGTVSGFEQIIGGDDTADRFAGSSRDERLFGRGSADELFGGGGADELFGGTGADVLFGGRGDDLLHGGAGDDDLRGGAGLDTANYANAVPGGLRAETTTTESAFGAVTVSLAAGTARGAAGGDALSGIENVYGSAAGDDIAGNAGPNALYGAGGDDLLRGGRGDDILVPGAGDDRIAGGPGNDRVVVDAGDLAVDGGDGWDRLDLGTVIGNVTLDFATGDYRARLYVDTAVWQDTGSSEPRVFEGTALTPRDVLETDPAFADDASDVDRELPPAPSSLEDDAERDAAARFNIMQASRPESYSGSLASIEKVVGGSAVTRLLPSLGVDRFDGTAETSTRDRIDLTRADGGVVFDLATGEARHALVAGDRFVGLEEIRGSRFADRLRGDGGDNTLIGEAGNDRLHGRQGADTLDGGPGNDAMTGGAGNDRFIIDDDDGRDRITDLGADDTLLLDPALWSGALTEAQIAARFGRSEAGGYRLSFADGESVFLIDADRALVVDSLEIA